MNCLLNYFFFVGEVVFLVLYFGVRFWNKPTIMIKKMGICLWCGILGVGMASILFIPSIWYILGNTRSHSNIGSITYNLLDTMFIIKGLFFPGNVMCNHSIISSQNWNSTSAYLPVIGISLSISYIIKQKDWLKRILIILLICSFSPILSSSFTLFTATYQRWWYMLILMMSLASVKVLDKKENFNYKLGIFLNIFLIILFCIVLVFLQSKVYDRNLILRENAFAFDVTFSIV